MDASLAQEDPAWTRRLAAAVLAAVVAPYLLLALCAYPALDDWVSAVAVRDRGVAGAIADYLGGWGGRWTAALVQNVFSALPGFPLTYPLAVLTGFALALWAAMRLGGWWWAGAALAGLAAWLPEPAEGLYWLSGGICYVLPFPLLLVAGGLTEHRWTPALRLLLGALAAGCSETAAVLAAGGLLAACLLHDRRHAWTLAGAVLGGAMILLAPGSHARLAHLGGVGADPLAACWQVLPLSARVLRRLAATALLTPLAPALVAALLAATPVVATSRWRSSAALLAVAGSALVAVVASLATVRQLEGRQVDAIWLHLVLGGAACAWALLVPLSWRWRCSALLVWWGLGWWRTARLDPDPWLPLLLLTACLIGAVLLAVWTWRRQRPVAVLWLALAALGAPRLPEAWGDVVDAGHRRAAQWRRDAVVARLAAAGERRLAIPLLDPRRFPAILSVGDLQTGHWAATAYAAWHGLTELRVDPRIEAPVPVEPTGVR